MRKISENGEIFENTKRHVEVSKKARNIYKESELPLLTPPHHRSLYIKLDHMTDHHIQKKQPRT